MKIIIAVLSCWLLTGCDNDHDLDNDEIQRFPSSRMGTRVKISVIDNCEYIFFDRGVAHKGNCSNKIHLYAVEKQ